MRTNYREGHFAEKIARCFLWLKGYRCVAQNFITGKGTNAGEIDLIVKRNKTLVFVEVKKRQTAQKAMYAITSKQQERLVKGALSFLKKHPEYQLYQKRFDVVMCVPNRLPKHIKNAWSGQCGLPVL